MTGNADTPSILQRQPAIAAAGVTATVSAVMAAFWAVTDDAGLLNWLTVSTQALITGAVLAVVALIAGWWAQRHSTPTAAPKVAEGSSIEVYNAAGATVGHVQAVVDDQPTTPKTTRRRR